MRNAGTGIAEATHFLVVEVYAVRKPDILAKPAELFEELHRTNPELLQAEILLHLPFRRGACEGERSVAGQLGRLGHKPGRHGRQRRGEGYLSIESNEGS